MSVLDLKSDPDAFETTNWMVLFRSLWACSGEIHSIFGPCLARTSVRKTVEHAIYQSHGIHRYFMLSGACSGSGSVGVGRHRPLTRVNLPPVDRVVTRIDVVQAILLADAVEVASTAGSHRRPFPVYPGQRSRPATDDPRAGRSPRRRPACPLCQRRVHPRRARRRRPRRRRFWSRRRGWRH